MYTSRFVFFRSLSCFQIFGFGMMPFYKCSSFVLLQLIQKLCKNFYYTVGLMLNFTAVTYFDVIIFLVLCYAHFWAIVPINKVPTSPSSKLSQVHSNHISVENR